jgi:hypothetical protein
VALAKAYAAGDEGLDGEYGDHGRIGWNTWLRLRDYKWGAFAKERETGEYHDFHAFRRMNITAAGRRVYAEQWSRYYEMHPDVEATQPVIVVRSEDRTDRRCYLAPRYS